jgi:glutaminyl-tRNA synthetase
MSTERESSNFIRDVILADNASGKWGGKVVTRFPPEPNGYLHIGHAKAICINFGLAAEFGGSCHLRYDDTNPTKEEVEYVEAMQRDIQWLGFEWGEHLYWASDYFERMAEDARELIRKGLAYVDESTLEELRAQRGTVTEAGVNSPYRERPIAESLDLFDKMLNGGIAEGGAVLRAKIDMASPNMKMRDPPFYRVLHAEHHHVGDRWKAYPLYDYAHCLEDSYEGVTHSLCTLEFENNRELYDWYLESLDKEHHPRQYEFARLAVTHTMMSKRKLLALVEEGVVSGWDDPRMPSLSGLRRRGVRPEAVRAFIDSLGVAKTNSVFEYERLDATIRDDLESIAPRVMGVIDPVRLIIENYPEGESEEFLLPHHPKVDLGGRSVRFSRELFIERGDFAETPPAKWKRLAPGREVRLRGACLVTCTGVDRDAAGAITAIRATWDPATRGGDAPDGRRPKGTIHWVSADRGVPIEVRLYDRLFAVETPDEGDFRANVNKDSLRVGRGVVEPAAIGLGRVQFERKGFFWPDPVTSTDDALVYNRIVGLRDSFKARPTAAPKKAAARKQKAGPAKAAELSRAEDALLAGAGGAGDVRALILNDLRRAMGGAAEGALLFDGAALRSVLDLVAGGSLGRGSVGKVLTELAASGGDPAAIVERLGLTQVSDTGALGALVDGVLAKFPDETSRFRAGEQRLMGFLMGQVMRASKGSADAKTVSGILRDRLSG